MTKVKDTEPARLDPARATEALEYPVDPLDGPGVFGGVTQEGVEVLRSCGSPGFRPEVVGGGSRGGTLERHPRVILGEIVGPFGTGTRKCPDVPCSGRIGESGPAESGS